MAAMAQRQRSEQFHFGDGSADEIVRPEEMPGEAQVGAVLARALIQHLSTMRALGYEDEIVVDGKVWSVEVRRKPHTA